MIVRRTGPVGPHFDIVDVFTDRAYAGNPLAVVHRTPPPCAAPVPGRPA